MDEILILYRSIPGELILLFKGLATIAAKRIIIVEISDQVFMGNKMREQQPSETAIAIRARVLSQENAAAPFTSDIVPAQQHVSPVFIVQNEVIWPLITPDGRLKGPPQIRLQWNFRQHQRGTIVGFRREDGFGSDGDRGEMIIRSACDSYTIEHLEPGEYFYSFFIETDLVFFRAYTNDVLFKQTMPSPAKVLEAMRHAIDFTKLQREFQALTEIPPPKSEDSKPCFQREFSDAMGTIDERFEAAKKLQERWDVAKQQILDGPESDDIKKKRLRTLNGIMREFREKFHL